MAITDSQTEINATYNETMFSKLVEDYYNGSDNYNFGYWEEDTPDASAASRNLVARLLDLIPEKTGRILDVACGKGATTLELLQYYPASNVTGINISEKQLNRCWTKAPDCTFIRMDATDLKFADNTFDAVICVEAAFHFNTREQFLAEALRVLRPGGRIALADLLTHQQAERTNRMRFPQNYLGSPEAYHDLLRKVGFDTVQVIDATVECNDRHHQHLFRFLLDCLAEGRLDKAHYVRAMRRLLWVMLTSEYYVLAGGRKPE